MNFCPFVNELRFSCLPLIETRAGRKKSRIIQNVSILGRWWTATTKVTFPVPRMVRGFIGIQEAEQRKDGVSQATP